MYAYLVCWPGEGYPHPNPTNITLSLNLTPPIMFGELELDFIWL